MARRRIQTKPSIELDLVTVRLPAELVRAVDEYARHIGARSDRTYVIAQPMEIALAQDREFQKASAAAPAAGARATA